MHLFIIVLGYFIGCFQTAFIVGKVAGIDIRNHGSGNAGTTNTMRVLGKKAAFIVFGGDVLKAFLGSLAIGYIFKDIGNAQLYAGIGIILGHNFPFYMNFKGGKGVASTLGTGLAFDWRIALLCLLFGSTLLAISKYVSLAALITMLLFIILTVFFGYSKETIILVTIMVALAYFQHRGNIKRLINRVENKFTFGKQDGAQEKIKTNINKTNK